MKPVSERASILIVDDEEINLELLKYTLASDYDIITATDGETAIQIAVEQQPDLVLLDIMMPGISGYEVCRQLKSNPATINIPIVFSTAKDSDEDEVLGLEMGAADYIHKPYKTALIKARISNQIELKQKNDLLEKLVRIDGLTEISNRRFFDESFEQEWRRAIRSGQSLALGLLDIDHFKQFNDNYGHAAGDKCLIQVAKCLEKQIRRSGDFVARYGGEEFVFLWLDADQEAAILLADKARKAISELNIAHHYSSCAKQVTASFGLAVVTPEAQWHKEALLQLADDNLYLAKERGRNQVVSAALEYTD